MVPNALSHVDISVGTCFFLENVEVSSQNTNLSNQSEVNKDTITQRRVTDNTKIFIIDLQNRFSRKNEHLIAIQTNSIALAVAVS